MFNPDSQAVLSDGVVLKRGDGGSPEGFDEIAEVREIDGFGFESALKDVSRLHTPQGFKEYTLGLKDPMEMTIKANLALPDDTQSPSAGLISDANTGTKRNYELDFTAVGGGTFSFKALARGFKLSAKEDDPLAVEFKLKPTGLIMYA